MAVWKQIPGTEYRVSDQGQFKNPKGRVLKPVRRGNGYAVILIHGIQYYAHRLVLWAFTDHLGEEANHLNRNKLDNRLCNLEWTNRKLNSQHYWRSVRLEMEARGQLRLVA